MDGNAYIRSDRAGVSLTPSPTMMTVWPSAFRRRTKAALSPSGRTSAWKSSTPTAAATTWAVRDVVAGHHHNVGNAQPVERLMGLRRFGPEGSAMRMTAARTPDTARYSGE